MSDSNHTNFTVEQMNQRDVELKQTIQNLWPVQSKKMLHLLVPPNEGIEVYIVNIVFSMKVYYIHISATRHAKIIYHVP